MGSDPPRPPRPARTLVERDELLARVAGLAHDIDLAYPDGVLLVAVLKGSLIFLADLVRAVTVGATIDFLAISTYEPDSGRVRVVKDLDSDITGRDVLLIEDIVDTGLTLAYLRAELARRDPRSIEVCTLLDKVARRIVPTELRFVGFEVPDEFVIGYGLDFAGRYRNLELIAAGEMDVLAGDPDAYVAQFYGRPPQRQVPAAKR